MKTFRFLGMLLVATLVAFGMSSCGDDENDEPFGGGTSQITVNGTTFKVNRAYWSAEVLNENDVFYTLYLYNCDATNPTDPWHAVTIIYKVVDGATDTFATGEFDDFEVSLSIVSADSSKDRWYLGNSNQDGNSAKLRVSKEGGITVSFDAMKYGDGINAPQYMGTSFTFTGSIQKYPTSK
ncbi:MAG: hypothetical protein J6X70_00190 [Muribaculaceae bacterium]|nr:hypothetical protein [Muribaculaceae bacterium]